jgi:hypothetical protein
MDTTAHQHMATDASLPAEPNPPSSFAPVGHQLAALRHSVLSKELQPGLRGHHLSAYARRVPPFNETTFDRILPDR